MNYIQLPSIYTKWRLLCLSSLNIFSTCGKIVYEQLTVDGVGGLLSVSSEMIL